MKKFLQILGILTIAVLLALIGFIVFYQLKIEPVKEEALVFLKDSIPAIVNKWDEKELLKVSSDPLKEEIKNPNNPRLKDIFKWLSTLGKVKKIDYDNMKNWNVNINTNGTTASFVIPAEFEAGAAVITANLSKKNSRWFYDGFRVNSDALLPK